jgi:hypothetical protein
VNPEPLFDSRSGSSRNVPSGQVDHAHAGQRERDVPEREIDPLSDSPSDSPRFRVKVAEPRKVREYVVTAKDRDSAWRYVTLHRDDLTPDDEYIEPGGVYWAASDSRPEPRDA